MHQLAICTVMANEAPYVEEWIHFHAKQGVDLFRIYLDRTRTDLPDDGTAGRLASMARDFNIEVIDWTTPGPQRQVAAFTAGALALRGRVRWAAFVDADEFLFDPHPLPAWLGGRMRDEVACDPPALIQWLAMLPASVSAVGVQQRLFGSSGRLDMPRDPVTAAYTLRAPADYPGNRWFKSIVRPERVKQFTNSHQAALIEGHYVLGDGCSFTTTATGCADRIAQTGLRLHHYMLKSREEWMAKKAKGAPSDGAAPGYKRFTEQYRTQDAACNATVDTTLADLHAPYADHKRREIEALKAFDMAH